SIPTVSLEVITESEDKYSLPSMRFLGEAARQAMARKHTEITCNMMRLNFITGLLFHKNNP
ncbi:MAG: hypothetical protein K2M29_03180, partial [Paramuribaculum sp.]|nr:hypothetical protein [Paramuribaculum sp.]